MRGAIPPLPYAPLWPTQTPFYLICWILLFNHGCRIQMVYN